MRTRMMVALAIVMFAVLSVPGQAQWGHDDSGSPLDVAAVHPDHDNGFCDNISGASGGRDVDCLDIAPNGPREWQTSCFDHNPNANGTSDLECSAYAVVYCPGLGTGTSPGKDYISFVCLASAGAEVRAGMLAGNGSYPLTKGVSCKNANTGRSVSCGCVVQSTTSSYFFGSPTSLGPNQYLCGDV